ncbi:MAG: ribulose-phosphate 3-epimerase [Tenericutes bacterium HGW-Tenericutes-5]|nr:MAG: ribulose-phosphate 3-epimerase [Tenericutes bacterium HGW-Tenericutes-5]
MILSPSFLSCDFKNLKEEIISVKKARWLHFDVMDGLFVTNTTYNHEMVKTIKAFSEQFFDVHLMIETPEKYYNDYIEAGADLITFHYEAVQDIFGLIKNIKDKNVLVGISIKPDTDVRVLDKYLPDLDLILIMSVEPGKGGQKFIPESIDKIKYLAEKRRIFNYKYLIEVDGGINLETAKTVKDAGCDVIVVGSFIFNQENRNDLIGELENV